MNHKINPFSLGVFLCLTAGWCSRVPNNRNTMRKAFLSLAAEQEMLFVTILVDKCAVWTLVRQNPPRKPLF